jgi:hypothetical protein
VALVETYTFQGVVPWVAVTLPLIGSVTDVEIYVCQGVVPCVAVIEPVTGNVAEVAT